MSSLITRRTFPTPSSRQTGCPIGLHPCSCDGVCNGRDSAVGMDCCSPRQSGPLLSATTCAAVSIRPALLWQIRDAFYPEILAGIPPDDGVSERTAFVPSVAAMQGVYLFPNPWVPYYYGAEGIPDADVLVNESVFVRFDPYREFDRVVEELMGSGDSEVVVDRPAPPDVQN